MTVHTVPAATSASPSAQTRMEMQIEMGIMVALGVLAVIAIYVTIARFNVELAQAIMATGAILAMFSGIAFLAARHKPSDEALEALAVGGHDRLNAVRNQWR